MQETVSLEGDTAGYLGGNWLVTGLYGGLVVIAAGEGFDGGTRGSSSGVLVAQAEGEIFGPH